MRVDIVSRVFDVSVWESAITSHPVFMGLLTLLGLFILVYGYYTIAGHNTKTGRRTIFRSGILALFIGLMVFPLATLNAIEAIEMSREEGGQMAIVAGGYYMLFVPFFYGGFWFMISLILCSISKRKR